MKHIHALTGLRGLAVSIVFITHSANESMLPDYLGKGFGQVGVMMFFVLSGFLMAHLYIKEDFNYANAKKYALARIGRVVPLYFVLLFVSILITKYIYNDFYYNFSETDVLMRAVFFIEAPYVFWTIPVEVQFYVIFMGFWFLYKKNASPYILAAYIIFTMLPSVWIFLEIGQKMKVVSLFSYAFFLGVVTALLREYIRRSVVIGKIASVAGYPLIILLFLNLPVLREQYGLVYANNIFFRTWGDPITWVIVYGLFICVILNSKSVAFLNHRLFVYLGSISYGFYLMHYPVLLYFKALEISSIAKLVLAFTVATVISHLSYNYFEKPAGKKIRNLRWMKSEETVN